MNRLLRYGCALTLAVTLASGFASWSALDRVLAQKQNQDQEDFFPTVIATPGATVFALATEPGLGARPQRLVTFEVTTPNSIRSDVRISGLQPGERLVGIDFRPATGQLFGLGVLLNSNSDGTVNTSVSRLYVIDPDTAVATAVTTGNLNPSVDATNFFGFDFNPVPDRIRVASNVNNQNLRLNPNSGGVQDSDAGTAGTQIDGALAYAAGDTNAGDEPNIVGAAYTNNAAGATATTNYAIDARPEGFARLVTQGTREGVTPAVSPNAGTLFTVAEITDATSGARLRTNNLVGFDIATGTGTAYVSLTPLEPFDAPSSLYSLNLADGRATRIGSVDGNLRLEGLTTAIGTRSISSVSFGAANYSVAENGGSISVTINRSDADVNTSGAVTVEFHTEDTTDATVPCSVASGVANSRCDFSAVVARVQFAPGATSQTFTIFINDDAFAEGTETFNITLTDASTGTAINGGSATITITDNDTVTATTNPTDTNEFFVRQQYLDFLNREPDATGRAGWLGVLTANGGAANRDARALVASGFSLSPEYLRENGYYSFRLYRAAFGRRQSYPEFASDTRLLAATAEDDTAARQAAFVEEFVTREEFRTRYGSLNNTQFVDRLYTTAGVAITDADRGALIARLELNQVSRARVLRDLIESETFFNQELNNGFVAAQYYGFLRREPEETGFQSWLRYLRDNAANQDRFRVVVGGFVNSNEYRQRFGTQ